VVFVESHHLKCLFRVSKSILERFWHYFPLNLLKMRVTIMAEPIKNNPLVSFDAGKDACGVGFAVNLKNKRSHEIVQQGVEILRNLSQRVPVDVVYEFDNIEAIKQAVEIGSYLSLLPHPTLDREIQAGTLFTVSPRGVRAVRPLAILRRHGAPGNPAATRVIELSRKPDAVPSAA
jgi:hypothetical protein